MKKTLFALVAFCLATQFTIAQTVDELVAKHVASRGGVEKLNAIQNITILNTMEVRDMEFENVMKILVNTAMRSDTKIMGNDMIQAFDGAMAWSVRPSMMGGSGEPEPMPEAMWKGVKRQADPFPLLNYAAKGGKTELLGTEEVKGIKCAHVKLSFDDAEPTEFWLNLADGLVVKQLVTSPMGAQEVYYSNYQEVEGVKFPFVMETENPQAGTIKITTTKIAINTKMSEDDFKMPAK